MAAKQAQSQRLPPTSIRDQLQEKRQSFRNDEHAASNTSDVLTTIVVSYLIIGFLSFTLFTLMGPDAATICDDTENFTAEDCTGATNFRDGFWVVMGFVTIAFVILIIGIVTMELKGRRKK